MYIKNYKELTLMQSSLWYIFWYLKNHGRFFFAEVKHRYAYLVSFKSILRSKYRSDLDSAGRENGTFKQVILRKLIRVDL